MIAKRENNLNSPFRQDKSDDKRAKQAATSVKTYNQRAKELMQSILSDFPAEEQVYSHNFD
jgi:hypothetical protein